MTFEEFFRKKKIDLPALEKAEPGLFSEFKTHFEQMGEKSFDHTKKYWFNKLRLSYHLAPEPKEEKVVIENRLAEQTISEAIAEAAPSPNVGFKPRFKAGMAKPAEQPAEATPEKPAAEESQPNTPPPNVGFKPRFKAGVTKAVSAEPAPEQPKETPAEEKTSDSTGSKPTYKPRFNMKNIKPKGEV